MIQATYISSATTPMSSDDLMKLLATSRDYNAANGITGMLLYYNETFLQVLEGDEETIDRLLKRIRRDRRHADFQLVERKAIDYREYSEWSMGFKKLSADQFREIPGLVDFDAANFNAGYLSQNANVLSALMKHFRKDRLRTIGQEELSLDEPDRLINFLHRVIRHMVRVVAVLMVFTIMWGVVDVVYALYSGVLSPAVERFEIRNIIITFGAFLTVLIAIEIFMNITLYLRDDVIHIRLVISTALMAIARKVIILDFDKVEPMYMFATAAIVVSLGIAYWLVGDRTFGASSRRRLAS